MSKKHLEMGLGGQERERMVCRELRYTVWHQMEAWQLNHGLRAESPRTTTLNTARHPSPCQTTSNPRTSRLHNQTQHHLFHLSNQLTPLRNVPRPFHPRNHLPPHTQQAKPPTNRPGRRTRHILPHIFRIKSLGPAMAGLRDNIFRVLWSLGTGGPGRYGG
jgi:hypothetical protein